MTLAQHSSASVEHYTPAVVITAVRMALGKIDLDPASCELANRHIGATTFLSEKDDGLDHPWWGRVFLNPPGGKVNGKSSQAIWWDKLLEEYQAGRTTSAIFLGFSLELLLSTQDSVLWPGHLAFCVPRKRIEFLNENNGILQPGLSPTHGNILVGLGVDRDRFSMAFKDIGKVRT